ncbi:MAG: S41 family peptidase [Chloroflexota bacterium]
MKKNPLRTILILFVVAILVVCGFGGGFVTGQMVPLEIFDLLTETPTPTPPPLPTSVPGTPPPDADALLTPFWEAWQIVHDNYVDQPIDDALLIQGAIRGMVDALGDDYSFYMDPQQYEDELAFMQGEYEGIGAWVDTTGDFLTVTSPIPGSPAEQAGLRPGDQIIAVDGDDVTGVDPETVRQRVLGPEGTAVHLTIEREGEEEPLEFDIVRARIVIPSVESEMLENNIGYIRLSIFGENTAMDFHTQLQELIAQNPSGIILDLRYNGGGYLSAAVSVTSEFLSEGVALYEEYGDGSRDPHPVTPGGVALDIPVVVLVNEGTASAAEIVAGAIQDYERGTLLGVTTFGKGSVQTWVPLSGLQGAVRVTIARWLTPNGHLIHGQGLTPDVIVEMTPEDYDNDVDPQLDAAINLLLNP